MPEMDGFEATIEIRRREALCRNHAPIVALTASVVEGVRRRCLAVGMDEAVHAGADEDGIDKMA